MTTISDYLQSVRLQQATQVLYPKQDYILSNFYLPYTEEEAYHYLINLPFTYLSCRYLGNQYYWEFVNSNNGTNFEDLQFVYYSVSNNNFESIKDKIPYYSTWNKDKQVQLVYPTINYLIEANSSSWGASYSVNISSGFTHPLLPTFEFTGRICLLNQSLLYEYRDLKGYYSVKDTYYLSPLRPIDLNYPLGIPTENQLIVEKCEVKNAYPSSGDSYFVGEYQYQYTTSNYNPHIKFYLYSNNTSQFLLQQPPKLDYKGAALSALSLVGSKPTLILPTESAKQSFTISQSSTSILTIL